MFIKLNHTKKVGLDNILFSLFLGIIFIGGILNLLANKTYTQDNWTIGEWLINYQGGFVRRGLGGELIYLISTKFKVSPIYLIWFISIFSYVFLLKESFNVCKNKVSNIFLLSPTIFLAPLVGNFLIRKDILTLMLFLINLKIIKKENPNFFIFQIINVIGILIHEVFAIYSFPIQFFILWHKAKSKRNFLIIFANFLIPFIIFTLSLFFKGDNYQAINIHNSWLSNSFLFPYENLNNQSPIGAINAISFDISHVIDLLKYSLTDFKGILWVPLAWLITILLAGGIFLGDNFSKDYKIKAFVLFFQFFPFSVLCLAGWDYGRWIFIWLLSSVLIYCSFTDELKNLRLENKLLKNYNFMLSPILRIELNNNSKLLLGLFFYPHCCWSIYYLPSLLILIIYSIIKDKRLPN